MKFFKLRLTLNFSIDYQLFMVLSDLSILSKITIDRLKMRTYVSMLELYNQIKPNTVLFSMT